MTEAKTRVPPALPSNGTPARGRGRRPHLSAHRPAKRLVTFKVLALAPLVAFVGVFALYPLVELIRMAFSTVTLRNGQFNWQFSGLVNITKAFQDPVFATSVKNSVVFAVATTVLTIVIGMALALLVNQARIFRGIARNIFIWPAVIAPVAVSVLWLLVFDSQLGVLNNLLADLGLPQQGWLGGEFTALAAVIVVDVWHWTPIVFLFVSAALVSMDEDVLDASKVDGATGWQRVRYITVPLLMPTLAVVAGIRIIMASKVFDELYLMTHGGPGTATTVVSIYVRNVFFDRVDLGYGAALGLIIVLAAASVFLIVGVIRRFTRRYS